MYRIKPDELYIISCEKGRDLISILITLCIGAQGVMQVNTSFDILYTFNLFFIHRLRIHYINCRPGRKVRLRFK